MYLHGYTSISPQRVDRRAGGFQPLVGPAGVHRHPPVYWVGVRLEHLQPGAHSRIRRGDPGAWRLVAELRRLDLLGGDRLSGPVRGACRQVAGEGRSALRGRHRGVLLGRRLRGRLAGDRHPPAVARLSRLRGDRRLRPRPRLRLAGVDADPLVSRPARHGDRHGDHGLRRRRDDRRSADRLAPPPLLRRADLSRADRRRRPDHPGGRPVRDRRRQPPGGRRGHRKCRG